MKVFDLTGDPQHDRFGRVGHQGTFNASQADRMADLLRRSWDEVLQRHRVAGYVYDLASTFHVYFETDRQRLAGVSQRNDLQTRDANRLKGMPGALIAEYTRQLRHRGVDIMSSTGGVLSASHTEQDIAQATTAFEGTVLALLEKKLIHTV
jgi:glutamate-1-semialdehyde aminotransferase